METPAAPAKSTFPSRAVLLAALAAFAVFAAYTQRMPSPFDGGMPEGTAGWHRKAAEFCHALWRGDELIGWALPTILAGTLAVAALFLAAARRNTASAAIAAAAMIGCGGLIRGIRLCDGDVFMMTALTLLVYAVGFLKGKWGPAMLLLWLAIWLVHSDSGGFVAGWRGVPEGLLAYSLTAPVAMLCGAGRLFRLLRTKKPEWQLVVTGVTPLLLIAGGRVWLISLPLAAWTVGEALTDGTWQLRKYLLWLLRAIPALGMVGFVVWAWQAGERFPDYRMPLFIPGMALAILTLGGFAVSKLDGTARCTVTACLAFATSAVAEVMVVEPFIWFTYGK